MKDSFPFHRIYGGTKCVSLVPETSLYPKWERVCSSTWLNENKKALFKVNWRGITLALTYNLVWKCLIQKSFLASNSVLFIVYL